MDKVSVSYLFSSQDIKQNVLSSSYLDSWWRHYFKIDLEWDSKAMVDREKKRGRQKYENLNISRMERVF